MAGTKLVDCFDNEGSLKFDPYRIDRDEDHRFYVVFNENGYLKDKQELKKLIKNKKWDWDSVAVALYHCDDLAINTKGSYPTYYYFR